MKLKIHWTKLRIVSLLLAFLGFVGTLVFTLIMTYSKGYRGSLSWFFPLLILICILFGLSLVCFIFLIISLFTEKTLKFTTIFSSITTGLCLVLTVFFIASSSLNIAVPNLDFYYSSDSYIKSTSDIHVAVISDTHYGAPKSNKSARQSILNQVNGNYDLVVHGGDVVDAGILKSHYKEAIKDMETLVPNQKISFVMGNHDALIFGSNNFHRIFQGQETGFSYVLNPAPNVHWVIFDHIWDTSEISKKEIQWLDDTLASFPEEDCVILQSHSFYYATGGVDGWGGNWFDIPDVIEKIVPVIKRNNVDLVISGHVHSFEFMKSDNIPYVLVGTSGGGLFPYQTVKTAAESLFLDQEHYGYTSVNIHSDHTMNVQFLNQDGSILYTADTLSY